MLTARQQDILEFITTFRHENGYSPTVREIGSYFGIASPNGVMCHVHALVKKGAITMRKDISRSIVPVLGERCEMCWRKF